MSQQDLRELGQHRREAQEALDAAVAAKDSEAVIKAERELRAAQAAYDDHLLELSKEALEISGLD